MFTFDFDSGQFTLLEVTGAVPSDRGNAMMCLMESNTRDMLFVYGGDTVGAGFVSDCYTFDIEK